MKNKEKKSRKYIDITAVSIGSAIGVTVSAIVLASTGGAAALGPTFASAIAVSGTMLGALLGGVVGSHSSLEKKIKVKFSNFRESLFCQSLPHPLSQTFCVEVAYKDGYVAIRNSADLKKTTLVFTIDEWRAFVKGVKTCEFDFPESPEL